MALTKFTLFAVILVILVSAVTAQFGSIYGRPGFVRPGFALGPGYAGGIYRPSGFGGYRPGYGGFRPGYGGFGPGLYF